MVESLNRSGCMDAVTAFDAWMSDNNSLINGFVSELRGAGKQPTFLAGRLPRSVKLSEDLGGGRRLVD